jgi:UDP-N-acetylglucosamine--N-acetylmuramyl-(pentapeptide) pyrophosphoryl-undecaprenol N-acetylglucosamine transferase
VNVAAVEAIGRLRERGDLQVLLLTGPAHEARVRAGLTGAGELRVAVRGFLDRMELAYALADLVVARAGATTCAEVSVCGAAAILVPYPHATGRHQEANARALERAGAAVVLLDEALNGETLAAAVTGLLEDEPRRARMASAMRAWSRPDAAASLAGLVARAGGEP